MGHDARLPRMIQELIPGFSCGFGWLHGLYKGSTFQALSGPKVVLQWLQLSATNGMILWQLGHLPGKGPSATGLTATGAAVTCGISLLQNLQRIASFLIDSAQNGHFFVSLASSVASPTGAVLRPPIAIKIAPAMNSPMPSVVLQSWWNLFIFPLSNPSSTKKLECPNENRPGDCADRSRAV